MTESGVPPRPIRVLHTPTTVGGNAPVLARAERALGLESWCVSVRPDAYGREVDEVLFRGRWDAPLLRVARRAGLLVRAATGYDVIHYNCGETILPVPYVLPPAGPSAWRALQERWSRAVGMRDLPLLKRLGLRVVVTYQGEEARLGDYCRAHFPIHWVHEVPDHYDPLLDERKRAAMALFGRHADRIYSLNPDLLHVLPSGAEFLPYTPIDLAGWSPVPARSGGDPVLVHAPSHRGIKGTRWVLQAVERLKAEGLRFELVLVEGMSHAQARREYERADLVIDQLLAGWYGGLAVEAMALGKPVVCYLREGDLGFLPAAMREELPLIQATPATIAEVLREWLGPRRRELGDVGRRGRSFVERWHDPLRVAARLKADYERLLAR